MRNPMRNAIPLLALSLTLGQASAHLYPITKDGETRLYDGNGAIVGRGYDRIEAYPSGDAADLWYGVRAEKGENGALVDIGELWTDDGVLVRGERGLQCTAITPSGAYAPDLRSNDMIVKTSIFAKGAVPKTALYDGDGKAIALPEGVTSSKYVYGMSCDDAYITVWKDGYAVLIDRTTGRYVEEVERSGRRLEALRVMNYYGDGIYAKEDGEGLYDLATGRCIRPIDVSKVGVQRAAENALRVDMRFGRVGLLRDDGTWIASPDHRDVGVPRADGLVAVQRTSHRWGVIAADGAQRVPADYDRIEMRDAGPILARKGSSIDIYARGGTRADIEALADARIAGAFAIAYRADGTRALLDASGKALPIPGTDFVPLGDARIAARQANGLWGAYDLSGKAIVAPTYAHIQRAEGRDAFIGWTRAGKALQAGLYAASDGRAYASGYDDIVPVGVDGYQLSRGRTRSLWIAGRICAIW